MAAGMAMLLKGLYAGGCAPTHTAAASLGPPFCLSVVLAPCFGLLPVVLVAPNISSVLLPSVVSGSLSATFRLQPPQQQRERLSHHTAVCAGTPPVMCSAAQALDG